MYLFLCLGSSIEENLLRYEKDIKLAGIIYLHRITDNRTGGNPYRMFEMLCRDQAFEKVVLVTTLWDVVQQVIGVRREMKLFENY